MRPNDGMSRSGGKEQRGGDAPPFRWKFRRQMSPIAWLSLALVLIALLLVGAVGPVAAGQTTLNGLVGAGYFALGAAGLTLVYGVLRLVNFAHGDMLTFGTYVALGVTALGVPFWWAAVVGMIATALLAILLDRVIWEPMRRARTSTLQLFLVATGLAMVLRYSVQFLAGSQVRTVGLDTTSSIDFGPWHLGTLQLVVMLVGLVTILLTGAGLRYTRLGKEMRAVADNIALAEVTGIDTGRTIRVTWLVAGGLAGLAGILYAAAIGTINPNFGFTILLSLFAAAVLGGIGNAYGALAGGVVIGLSQEWSTLFFNPRWKPAIVYAIFVLGLQLNVGFTGLLNLGQAGFMGIGAYAMGMLVTDAGWSIFAAMPAAVLITVAAGLLVGLSSLRLRSDYFAIATIALAATRSYRFSFSCGSPSVSASPVSGYFRLVPGAASSGRSGRMRRPPPPWARMCCLTSCSRWR